MLLKADYLNEHCHCSTLDKEKLSYAHYFSEQPHFLARDHWHKISDFVQTYDAALRSPFVRSALNANPTERGIFNSYDFHIGEAGPQLIEINTNAAGAVLGNYATRDMHSCCETSQNIAEKLLGAGVLPTIKPYRFDEQQIISMFRGEFALRFPGRELTRVAIVDDQPEQQFFYPEFLLVKDLLRRHGIDAVIAAPASIVVRDDKVCAGDLQVDFIYNRLTDFALEQPEHEALLIAYEQGLVTVSPNPALHALYARKSNLVAFWSRAFDVLPGIDLLRAHIPETRLVTAENRDELWQTRKQWFFKPVSGYGGKAVYRGDKITTRVWADLGPGEYIAQRYIPPTTRRLKADVSLKYDLRVYTYGDEILGMLARYYQGQTTNFRTEHGGLAAVMLAA